MSCAIAAADSMARAAMRFLAESVPTSRRVNQQMPVPAPGRYVRIKVGVRSTEIVWILTTNDDKQHLSHDAHTCSDFNIGIRPPFHRSRVPRVQGILP